MFNPIFCNLLVSDVLLVIIGPFLPNGSSMPVAITWKEYIEPGSRSVRVNLPSSAITVIPMMFSEGSCLEMTLTLIGRLFLSRQPIGVHLNVMLVSVSSVTARLVTWTSGAVS